MRLHPVITLTAWLALVLLWLPLVVLAVLSFNADKFGRGWDFSLIWYGKLLANAKVHEAAWNTLILAVTSTAVSTVLGTGIALGLHRLPWPRWLKGIFDVIIHLPVVTPDIILAAAMVVVFALFHAVAPSLELGMPVMILGHVTFQLAFVTLVVSSRLALIDSDQEEAARDLYAGRRYTLIHVILPQLMPGIIAGAMLAFVLSLDDFVVSLFTASVDSNTLPLLIYATVKRSVTPEIHALSTVIVAITVFLVLLMTRLNPAAKSRD